MSDELRCWSDAALHECEAGEMYAEDQALHKHDHTSAAHVRIW